MVEDTNKPPCPHCGETNVRKNGKRGNTQRYICNGEDCGKGFTAKATDIPNKNKTTFDYSGSNLTVDGSIYTKNIERPKILKEFIDKYQIDTKLYKIERVVFNTWDTTISGRRSSTGQDVVYTNHQLKVVLVKRKNLDLELGYEEYIKGLSKFKYSKIPHFKAESGIALEISLFDAHIGKLSWELETGRRNYNLKQAYSDYQYAIDEILHNSMPFKPEKIFYVIGQDLLHVDNLEGVTPRGGFVLDADGRLPKIFETTFKAVTEGVYKARAVAPVELIWIPGNHDELASLFLCYALREHFKDDDYVTVDLSPQSRKVRLWGTLLVGWTHEINRRQEAWANELAQAFPKEWAKSEFREWHHGHKHKGKEIKTLPTLTSGGVVCRQITGLTEIDKWHYTNMFTDAVPGGEGFLWSKTKGIKHILPVWTKHRQIIS